MVPPPALWCGGPAVLWSLACDACSPPPSVVWTRGPVDPGRGKDVAGTIRNRYEIVRFRKEIVTKSYDFEAKRSPNRYEIVRFQCKSYMIVPSRLESSPNRSISL